MHRYHRLLTLLLVQATYEPAFVAAFIGPDARTARSMLLAPSATFFDVLAEDTILIDPADGTCCRNECASCSYHEEIDGEITYAYEEKTGGRWLPTQAETSVPPRLQTAKWVDVVFGEATNVTRDGFEAALDELPAEEIDVAWRTLTSAPKLLRKNEVQSKPPSTITDWRGRRGHVGRGRGGDACRAGGRRGRLRVHGNGGPQGALQRPRHQAATRPTTRHRGPALLRRTRRRRRPASRDEAAEPSQEEEIILFVKPSP